MHPPARLHSSHHPDARRQRGNRQQKRESVYRQRDGEAFFLAQATSSGTVWENSLILILALRFARGDMNITPQGNIRS